MEWDFAWRSSKTKATSKRAKILSAMGCSPDGKHLKQLLSRIFHPSIRQEPAESETLFKGMCRGSLKARKLVVDFIRANRKPLEKQ